MLVYYGVAAVATVLGALSDGVGRAMRDGREDAVPGDRRARRYWTPFDLLAVALLTGFSGLRYMVGTDYPLYTAVFQQLRVEDWPSSLTNSPQEPGFTMIALLVKSVVPDVAALFWVCSALTTLLVYSALRKQSTFLALALALYVLLAFYVTPFNVVRQGLAVAVLFWANQFIKTHKIGWTVAALLAFSLHASALPAAALQLVLSRWRPSLRAFIVLLATSLFTAEFVLTNPSVIAIVASLNPRYAGYLGTDQASGIGTYLGVAVFTGFAVLALVLARRSLVTTRPWLAYVCLAPAALSLGTRFEVIGRMDGYFTIFIVLLIPNLIENSRRRGVLTAIVTTVGVVYFGFYLQNFADLIPYRVR